MAPYCAETDLLIASNLPIPTGLSKTTYVQQGADEIDARIGGKFVTPVVFTSAGDQTKYAATIQLLKMINVHLSTGRLIMAMDAPGENNALHAYGTSLVRGALRILDQILDGEIILEGATPRDAEASALTGSSRPMLLNTDPTSLVEDFYAITQAPTPIYLPLRLTDGY